MLVGSRLFSELYALIRTTAVALLTAYDIAYADLALVNG
jgi:hypothetical protein